MTSLEKDAGNREWVNNTNETDDKNCNSEKNAAKESESLDKKEDTQ